MTTGARYLGYVLGKGEYIRSPEWCPHEDQIRWDTKTAPSSPPLVLRLFGLVNGNGNAKDDRKRWLRQYCFNPESKTLLEELASVFDTMTHEQATLLQRDVDEKVPRLMQLLAMAREPQPTLSSPSPVSGQPTTPPSSFSSTPPSPLEPMTPPLISTSSTSPSSLLVSIPTSQQQPPSVAREGKTELKIDIHSPDYLGQLDREYPVREFPRQGDPGQPPPLPERLRPLILEESMLLVHPELREHFVKQPCVGLRDPIEHVLEKDQFVEEDLPNVWRFRKVEDRALGKLPQLACRFTYNLARALAGGKRKDPSDIGGYHVEETIAKLKTLPTPPDQEPVHWMTEEEIAEAREQSNREQAEQIQAAWRSQEAETRRLQEQADAEAAQRLQAEMAEVQREQERQDEAAARLLARQWGSYSEE